MCRIGRTGRGGRKGTALTFFLQEDSQQLRAIANVMRAAGCEIPPWMLLLKKARSGRSKAQRLAGDMRGGLLARADDSDDEAATAPVEKRKWNKNASSGQLPVQGRVKRARKEDLEAGEAPVGVGVRAHAAGDKGARKAAAGKAGARSEVPAVAAPKKGGAVAPGKARKPSRAVRQR